MGWQWQRLPERSRRRRAALAMADFAACGAWAGATWYWAERVRGRAVVGEGQRLEGDPTNRKQGETAFLQRAEQPKSQ